MRCLGTAFTNAKRRQAAALRRPCYDPRAMKRLLPILLLMAAPVLAKEVLPFIDNDYSTALARAKTKNVPIFVEAWAHW